VASVAARIPRLVGNMNARRLTACCRLRACGAPSQPAGNARGACGGPGSLCGILRCDRPGGRFGNTITLWVIRLSTLRWPTSCTKSSRKGPAGPVTGQFMTEEEFDQAVSGVARVVNRATASVLFQRHLETPQFEASGVIVQVGRQPFLFTAAHALDARDGRKLVVSLDEHLIALPSPRPLTTTSPDGSREADRIDLAAVPLPIKAVEESGARVVQLSEIESDPQPDQDGLYLLLGMPATKQRNRAREGALAGFVYPLIATAMPSEFDDQFGGVIHLNLKVDRKDVYQEGEKRTAPSLKGMSGCGAWVIERHVSGGVQARLSGIVIEHHRTQHRVVATRPAVLVDAIQHHLPEVFQETRAPAANDP